MPIPLARISDRAGQAEPEPRLVFHAAQHANECNGTGAVMKHDGQPARRLRQMIRRSRRGWMDLELIFVPVFNPDGHAYVFDGAA